MTDRCSEAAFGTAIEAHLMGHGYAAAPKESFDRERAIFPETALEFIRETQSAEWNKLEALIAAVVTGQIDVGSDGHVNGGAHAH